VYEPLRSLHLTFQEQRHRGRGEACYFTNAEKLSQVAATGKRPGMFLSLKKHRERSARNASVINRGWKNMHCGNARLDVKM